MNRKDRRAHDKFVQEKKELHLAQSIFGDTPGMGGGKIFNPRASARDAGGYGNNMPGSKPAGGDKPPANPFMTPKPAGLTITSQTYPSNYYVEWNLSTWRYACDQAIKFGYTTSIATLYSWAFECSPFIQSLFRQLGAALGKIEFQWLDDKGNVDPLWTQELCKKPWQINLRKEILYGHFWGFSGLNFDPIGGQVYKYPMQDIDPINRMLRATTYSFYEGEMFSNSDNLLFIQPSTSYEQFLGWMQPITRSFIQMNLNKNNWVSAGKKLAFPMLAIGYPQNDNSLDSKGNPINQYRLQAEDIASNLDPSRGLVYPYTVDEKGNIIKSINVDFEKTGTGSRAHGIFEDFNESEKNEIREFILGGQLTSAVGKSGSRALGEVQERKLETINEELVEYVLAILNEQYLHKISKFYKNFPKGHFEINRARQMPLDDIVKISNVVTENGFRLNENFFDVNGIAKTFLEDLPTQNAGKPGQSKESDDNDNVSLAGKTERTFFKSKKKS